MRRAVEEILTESGDDDYEGDPGCFGGENRAAPIPESSLGLIFGTTNVSGTRAPQGGMFLIKNPYPLQYRFQYRFLIDFVPIWGAPWTPKSFKTM